MSNFWERTVWLLAFLLVLLLGGRAAAEPVITPHYLPAGVQWKSGTEERKCYSLEEYKLVLQVDYDLYNYKAESALIKDELRLVQQQAELYRQNIGSLMADINIWKSEYQRSNQLWKETDQRLQDAKGSSGMFWMVLGGEVAVVAVSITVLVLALR